VTFSIDMAKYVTCVTLLMNHQPPPSHCQHLPRSQHDENARRGLRGGRNGCKHMVTHPFPPEGMFLYTLTTSIYQLLFYVVFQLLPPPYPSLSRNASWRGHLLPPTTPHPSLSRVFWWSCPPPPHHLFPCSNHGCLLSPTTLIPLPC